jgi:hypothetical protein
LVAYLLLGLNALDLRDVVGGAEPRRRRRRSSRCCSPRGCSSNRLRGVAAFARPTDIDAPELLLFVFGPALPVLVFGQVGDAIESVVTGAGTAAADLPVVVVRHRPLLRWGARRSGGQLTGLGPLVAKALPLLLVFNTFLFVNAEVWEMAGTLDGAAYVVVVLTFFALGAVFAISRLPGFIRRRTASSRGPMSPAYVRTPLPTASSCQPTDRPVIRSAHASDSTSA